VRVLFAGSPDIAVPSLEAAAASAEIVGVLTNPPAPRGRGLAPAPTPVAEAAARLLPGVPVLSPERLGPPERAAVAALRPDVLAVFAYGRIFGPKFLALFPAGAVNVHPSLLPRWRGCAPIPYAILHHDPVTGVSVQRIALEVDSGDILARQEIALSGRETTASLGSTCAAVGAGLLAGVLRRMDAGTLVGESQDASRATWSRTLAKDDGLLDWSLPAVELDARVRAYDPWPLAFTALNGERLLVLSAMPYPDEPAAGPPGAVLYTDRTRGIMVGTGRGVLGLERLQLRGRKALGFREFANGARGLAGAVLGG